ncbi:MAG TPA: hypothetical protein VGE76_22655 [Opitutaceae bacterium]
MYRHQKAKGGKILGTTLGVAFPYPLYFRLSRETSFDGFCKRSGISREQQTDDEHFDRHVYVMCDHPDFGLALRDDAATRATILDLLYTEEAKEIYSDGKHVWVQLNGERAGDESAVRKLTTIRAALQRLPPYRWAAVRDSFMWRALSIEAVVGGLACYGILAMAEWSMLPEYNYLSWGPIILWGLGFSVGIYVALYVAMKRLLGGSSRAHRLLVEGGAILLIGIPPSAVVLASDINRGLDRAPAVVVYREVESKTMESGRGRRKNTKCYLTLRPSADDGYRIPSRFTVSYGTYGSVGPGSKLALTIGQGALGVPWIEKIAPAP